MSIRQKQLKVFAKWLQEYSYNRRNSDGKLESEVGFAIEESTNRIGDYLETILEMDVEQLNKEL